MKTKLVPLALLIPAVVLAQPAPQAPAPQPPQNQLIPNTIEKNTLSNPASLNKAAAQALSKARIKRPSDSVGSADGYYTTYEGSKFYCANASGGECTNTKYL